MDCFVKLIDRFDAGGGVFWAVGLLFCFVESINSQSESIVVTVSYQYCRCSCYAVCVCSLSIWLYLEMSTNWTTITVGRRCCFCCCAIVILSIRGEMIQDTLRKQRKSCRQWCQGGVIICPVDGRTEKMLRGKWEGNDLICPLRCCWVLHCTADQQSPTQLHACDAPFPGYGLNNFTFPASSQIRDSNKKFGGHTSKKTLYENTH